MLGTLSSSPCGLKLTTSGLSYLARRGGLDASCQSFRLEKTPPTNQAEIDAPNKAIERARKHFGIMLEHPADHSLRISRDAQRRPREVFLSLTSPSERTAPCDYFIFA